MHEVAPVSKAPVVVADDPAGKVPASHCTHAKPSADAKPGAHAPQIPPPSVNGAVPAVQVAAPNFAQVAQMDSATVLRVRFIAVVILDTFSERDVTIVLYWVVV